jgi:hypothetical protein
MSDYKRLEDIEFKYGDRWLKGNYLGDALDGAMFASVVPLNSVATVIVPYRDIRRPVTRRKVMMQAWSSKNLGGFKIEEADDPPLEGFWFKSGEPFEHEFEY